MTRDRNRSGPISAVELMAQLQNNPEYLRKVEKAEAERQKNVQKQSSEPELTKALEAHARQTWRDRNMELRPSNFGKQTAVPALGPEVVADIVVQLFALGVIERGVKKRTVSDKSKYWALTDLGQDQMMKLRAIRRV